jgi:hypothetical protein
LPSIRIPLMASAPDPSDLKSAREPELGYAEDCEAGTGDQRSARELDGQEFVLLRVVPRGAADRRVGHHPGFHERGRENARLARDDDARRVRAGGGAEVERCGSGQVKSKFNALMAKLGVMPFETTSDEVSAPYP